MTSSKEVEGVKIGLECIPCFVRQAYEAVRFVTDDQKSRERIVKQVLFRMANESFDKTPPSVGGDIHRIVRCLSGERDPYLEIKKDSNELAMRLMPSFKAHIRSSPDPFETALRLAIAGNVIDSAQGDRISEQVIQDAVSQSLDQSISKDIINELREQIGKATHILYLGDNAGEIVFDRLLIEELDGCHITFAVRGAPILNDALIDDARMAGLDTLVEVVDNGSDVPGTILEECSDDFRRSFMDTDLVIAKGQGNYETLGEEQKKIFFLLQAKCPVIARDIGCEQGDMAIVKKGC
ncbi:MAG: hypothetical protein DRG87_03835 [Deltaproteobacteria bacterium]|nr:MAG: hypothetical protein DRG87_03835 [Deltaproteobacteria bacterium]